MFAPAQAWFDLRIGQQIPLVALNLVFNTSNSSPIGLGETSIWLFDWKQQQYVKVIDAAKAAGASPIGLQIDDLTE